MSNIVSSLAQRKVLGSATKKSVMMYLADRASDDGSGIWTSKTHISDDTELSKRAVQTAIKDFEADGLLRKTGKKACPRGYTFEYQIMVDAVAMLPSTRNSTGAGGAPLEAKQRGAGGAPVQVVHPRGAGGAPEEVQVVHPNHPLTIHEPSNKTERASACDFDFDIPKQEEPKPAAKSAGGATGVPETRTPVEIEFGLFMKASPRELDESAKEAEFEKAWPAFQKASELVPAQTLTKAIKAYAKSCTRSNKENKYIKYPSTWLADKRWRDFPSAKSPAATSADQATKLRYYADILNGNEPIHPSLISSSLAEELFESGEVTAEVLQARLG